MLDPYKQLQINGKLNTLQVVQMLRDMDKRITELEKGTNEEPERQTTSTRRTASKDSGKTVPST